MAKRKRAPSIESRIKPFLKKKTVWAFLAEHNQNDAETLSSEIKDISNGTVVLKTPQIKYLIQKGIKGNKLKDIEFPRIFKKRKPKKPAIITKKEKPIIVKLECECGFKMNSHAYEHQIFSNCLIGIKAMRCNKCNKWKTYKAHLTIDKKNIIKGIVTDADGRTLEDFINPKGKRIKNPLAPKTIERLRMKDEQHNLYSEE